MKKKVVIAILIVVLAGGGITGGVVGYRAYQNSKLVAEVQSVSMLNTGSWGDSMESDGTVTNGQQQDVYVSTEQTIQPDPVKPEYTEDELKDPTKTPDGTPVEGTPEPQDHNNVTPPPEQPSTNTSGGLPGFDNVPNAGANQGGSIDSDGDINTQVGIMG